MKRVSNERLSLERLLLLGFVEHAKKVQMGLVLGKLRNHTRILETMISDCPAVMKNYIVSCLCQGNSRHFKLVNSLSNLPVRVRESSENVQEALKVENFESVGQQLQEQWFLIVVDSLKQEVGNAAKEPDLDGDDSPRVRDLLNRRKSGLVRS